MESNEYHGSCTVDPTTQILFELLTMPLLQAVKSLWLSALLKGKTSFVFAECVGDLCFQKISLLMLNIHPHRVALITL